jgi:CubicO group peptidase (beta-lactamase class C family)
MLLRGGMTVSGAQVLQPETVAQMTRRDREGAFDVTFQHVVDFGLGVIVNSRRYGEHVPYGFGSNAAESSFGHGGSQSSIGFADPENGVVVAAVANGFPGEEAHNDRFRALNTAIYEDLGIAS